MLMKKKTHSKLKINKGKREKFLCLLVREMALNFSFQDLRVFNVAIWQSRDEYILAEESNTSNVFILVTDID